MERDADHKEPFQNGKIDNEKLELSQVPNDKINEKEGHNEIDVNQKVNDITNQIKAVKNEEIDEDLELGFCVIMKYAPSFYMQSLPLVFLQIYPNLLNFLALFWLGYYNDVTLTAGFGLGNSQFLFFFQVFHQVNSEVAGLYISQSFGAGDYTQMRLAFYRGLIFNYCITAFAILFFIRIDLILIAIGFDEELAKVSHSMVLYLIPGLIIQSFNEMMKTLLISQNVHKPFFLLNAIVIFMIPFGTWIFMYKLDLQILGFGIFKLMLEIIYMIWLIGILKKTAHPESLKPESLSQVLSGFLAQAGQFFKIVLGWYGEYIGFEGNTILIGLLRDNYLMSAWVSVMNVDCIIWACGFGLGNTTRTLTGISIGEGRQAQAKKYAIMSLCYTFMYSITMCIILIFTRHWITAFFTDIEGISVKLESMLLMEGFIAIFSGAGSVNSTLLRVIGKSWVYSLLMIVDQILLWDGLSSIFLFVIGDTTNGVLYASLCAWTITITTGCCFIIFYDWNKVAVLIDRRVEAAHSMTSYQRLAPETISRVSGYDKSSVGERLAIDQKEQRARLQSGESRDNRIRGVSFGK